MTRPQYETPADIQREKWVVAAIERAWSCGFVKFPPCAQIEGALHRWPDPISALVEIKCRTNTADKYETYMISAEKIRAGKQWSDRFGGVPFFLVVSWVDRVGWWKLPFDFSAKTSQGGRRDRNDPADIEAVLHIPVSDFRQLNAAGVRCLL